MAGISVLSRGRSTFVSSLAGKIFLLCSIVVMFVMNKSDLTYRDILLVRSEPIRAKFGTS